MSVVDRPTADGESIFSADSAAAIEIRNLNKRFGGLRALTELSLTISPHVVHSVIGPNGAGKTCVFNCIMGQYKPDNGEIIASGERIDGLEPHQVAMVGISRTYQNIRLFRNMTALENVMVGRHRCIRANLFDTIIGNRRFRQEEASAQERSKKLLDLVGMPGRGDVLARNLSYGEQRRLEIARALATEPKVILLDEPAAGMNPIESDRLMDLIRELRDLQGITIVLIEHEMRVVMGISDKISVLDRGQLLTEGGVKEVRKDKRVIEAYLGSGATRYHRTKRSDVR